MISETFFKLWTELDYFESGEAISFLGHNQRSISFILAQSYEHVDQLDDTPIKHHFHHIFWHFLNRLNLLGAPDSNEALENQSFSLFREKVSSHIVHQRDKIDVSKIKIDALVHQPNSELRHKANQARDKFHAITEVARAMGISMETLTYPISRSRNFDELINSSLRIIETTPKEVEQVLQVLYEIWKSDTKIDWRANKIVSRHWMDEIIRKVISSADLQLSREAASAYFSKAYLSNDIVSTLRVRDEAMQFSQFIELFFGLEIDSEEMLEERVESRKQPSLVAAD